MTHFLKLLLHVHLAALFLAAALPGALAAQNALPFRGSMQGAEIATLEFPSIFVDGQGSGNATHLGRFTFAYDLEVDLLMLPFETFGSGVFTAANGDLLATDIVGRGTPTEDPNVLSVREEHIITGGSGRFSNAMGSFVRTYFLDRVTGVTVGSFQGTIELD